MDAESYKKQFIHFIKILYPDGVPKDVNGVVLTSGSEKFKFSFDNEDLNISPSKDISKIEKNDIFSEDDYKFLNGLKIST